MPKREPIIVDNGMVFILLTMGLYTLIDYADLPLVADYDWQAMERYDGNGWYAVSQSGRLRMHRVILGARRGQLVDHRDGNGLHNRRSNLRIGTKAQNAQNRLTAARELPTGVYQAGQRYFARIAGGGKYKSLGGYATPEEAHAAYVREAAARYGDWLHPSFRKNL